MVDRMMKQQYPRYHWIPVKLATVDGHVADFAFVTSLAASEVRRLTRMASLVSSWREQLPARYVAYMGRVGTEDSPPEELKAHRDRIVAGLIARL